MKLKQNELCKDINGLENKYAISSMGRVWAYPNNANSKEGGFLILNSSHYLSVVLCGKKKYVHRLVAEAYIHNPNNLDTVNHKDGDKLNCSINNLEWCSSSENQKHAWDTGLRSVTEKMRASMKNMSYRDRIKGTKKGALKRIKVAEDIAKKLREEYIPYHNSFKALGEKYNLPTTTVQYIIKKRIRHKNANTKA